MNMNYSTKLDLQSLPSVLPAEKLCEIFAINPQTFRVLMHRCRKLGVPLPPRKRILRRYFYEVNAFSSWLWTHGEKLKGKYESNETADE